MLISGELLWFLSRRSLSIKLHHPFTNLGLFLGGNCVILAFKLSKNCFKEDYCLKLKLDARDSLLSLTEEESFSGRLRGNQEKEIVTSRMYSPHRD